MRSSAGAAARGTTAVAFLLALLRVLTGTLPWPKCFGKAALKGII